ncbi:hypothetical protein [Thioalkalivibrio sulfidiphilus]|uniref:hypothetical protein n=1 Tax=Thioalkalivibrio sulfidiphilus TaxID=1033854 RepID=UPI0003715118|nr:hypothetical protein [Thioalkalivibrio sulfidiphilus]
MLWFGKQAKGQKTGGGDEIAAADLEITLDKEIASSKFRTLLEQIEERGTTIEFFLEALRSKHELFARVLPAEKPQYLSRDDVMLLLAVIFPARRKLESHLASLDDAALSDAVLALVYGEGRLEERINAFCELIPETDKKARRAIWDLAAELLHFRDPERVPLMTRWVWDTRTMTGAVREFIRGNDTLREIPMGTRPEDFQGVRAWFAERLSEDGLYRDLPYLVDLLQGQAYADYVKAVSMGVGMVNAELGAKQDPLEFLVKLLGIEERPARKAGADEKTLH